MSQMISYVLFDPETRELLGGYLQVPPSNHTHYILVNDELRVSWPVYMLNEDMTALVKNPIYWEPQPPEFDPSEPPVDPEPEEPVQSGN